MIPDFTTEYHSVCNSIDSPGNVGGYRQSLEMVPYEGMLWTCSCKAFQFGKKPVSERSCKHLKEFHESRCAWEQFFAGGDVVDGKCPKCGGPVRSEGYAV